MKIIFDFDGTVVDVWERYYSILNRYVKERFGVEINKEPYRILKKQLRKDDLIVKTLTAIQIDVDDYVSFKRKYLEEREYLSKDVLIKNAESVLSELRDAGYEIALLTARRREKNLLWQLETLNLVQFFDSIWVVPPEKGNKVRFLKEKISFSDVVVGDGCEELDCVSEYGCTGYYTESGITECDEEYLVKNGIKKIRDIGALPKELIP